MNQKKSKNKESKYLRTPKFDENEVFRKKTSVAFFVWNIFSILLYSSYTFFVIYKLSFKSVLSKIIEYLLIVYAVVFMLLVLFNLGNSSKLKFKLKNYKSSITFFKYTIQIINFVLSIVTAISAFLANGKLDFSVVFYAIISLIITIVLIIVEVAKVVIRKNMSLIKRNFLDIREYKSKNKS